MSVNTDLTSFPFTPPGEEKWDLFVIKKNRRVDMATAQRARFRRALAPRGPPRRRPARGGALWRCASRRDFPLCPPVPVATRSLLREASARVPGRRRPPGSRPATHSQSRFAERLSRQRWWPARSSASKRPTLWLLCGMCQGRARVCSRLVGRGGLRRLLHACCARACPRRVSEQGCSRKRQLLSGRLFQGSRNARDPLRASRAKK